MAGINERQEALNLSLPKAVAVIGCGGVGSWTAYLLALAGVKELYLFDSDTISDHNLNRIPFPMSSVGKKKTEALAELIATVRPSCICYPMGKFETEIADSLQLQNLVSWVAVTTDTLASRQTVKDWVDKARKKFYARISYIEAAAEGEMGSCTGSPAEWSTPQESQPGYQSVPVWVGPCIFSAGVAVAHIIHDTEMGDRAIRMGWENDSAMFSMFDSSVEEEEVENEPSEQEAAKEGEAA